MECARSCCDVQSIREISFSVGRCVTPQSAVIVIVIPLPIEQPSITFQLATLTFLARSIPGSWKRLRTA